MAAEVFDRHRAVDDGELAVLARNLLVDELHVGRREAPDDTRFREIDANAPLRTEEGEERSHTRILPLVR